MGYFSKALLFPFSGQRCRWGNRIIEKEENASKDVNFLLFLNCVEENFYVPRHNKRQHFYTIKAFHKKLLPNFFFPNFTSIIFFRIHFHLFLTKQGNTVKLCEIILKMASFCLLAASPSSFVQSCETTFEETNLES